MAQTEDSARDGRGDSQAGTQVAAGAGGPGASPRLGPRRRRRPGLRLDPTGAGFQVCSIVTEQAGLFNFHVWLALALAGRRRYSGLAAPAGPASPRLRLRLVRAVNRPAALARLRLSLRPATAPPQTLRIGFGFTVCPGPGPARAPDLSATV